MKRAVVCVMVQVQLTAVAHCAVPTATRSLRGPHSHSHTAQLSAVDHCAVPIHPQHSCQRSVTAQSQFIHSTAVSGRSLRNPHSHTHTAQLSAVGHCAVPTATRSLCGPHSHSVTVWSPQPLGHCVVPTATHTAESGRSLRSPHSHSHTAQLTVVGHSAVPTHPQYS